MAFTITDYTPTTGPDTGGTLCTVTGTGLAVVDVVLVNDVEAAIVGTPGATTMQFRTPPGADGAADVVLVDTDANESHTAGTPFTYTAVAADEALITRLAAELRLDVRNVGDTDWTHVRATSTLKPGLDYTTEDDSDTDSGIDGADLIVGRKAALTGTVKRGRGAVTGNPDPGQEIIRIAADSAGTPAGTIEARWYVRGGGPEAYQATTLAQWSPQGGNKTADKVDFTLNVQGARTTIANPVIADPTLAGPYA